MRIFQKYRRQDAETLPRGTKLAGKYIVSGVIGHGGFGITYLAFDVIADKKISAYNDSLARFAEESSRVSQFNGNLIYGVFVVITLEKYIKNHDATNVEQCIYPAEKLALVAIHSARFSTSISPPIIMRALKNSDSLEKELVFLVPSFLGLSVEDFQRMLNLAGRHSLYVKNMLDAKVFCAIKHKMNYENAVAFVWENA